MRKPDFPNACAWFVLIVCLTVIAGWQFDVVLLRRLLPWAPPTTPLTAVMLLLLGGSLLSSVRLRNGKTVSQAAWLTHGLSLAALSIAGWSGIQYLCELKPGLELVLYGEKVAAGGGAFPGRPSPHTVIAGLLMGLAIGLSPLEKPSLKRIAAILNILGILLPWLALFGYASLTNPFYSVDNAPQTGMSPLTALSFIALGIGVIGLRADQGLAALFSSNSSGGQTARRILPVVLLTPLAFGWIIIYGRQAEMLDPTFGIALSWGMTSLLFAALLLWQSFNINKIDESRRRAFDDHEQLIQVLEKEKEKFRNLLELAPDSMIIANEMGVIVMVNAQAEQLFSYDRKELIGQPVEKLIPQRFHAGHPAHRKKYHDAPHARPMGSGRELFGLSKDGREIPVEVSLNVLATEEGRLVLAAVRDVTDQKCAAEQIKQSNAVLKQQAEALEKSNMELQHFAYVVSHDLQTPLRSICGFVQLLQQQYGEKLDEQAGEWIRRTVVNTQRMQTLIRDILAYSRVEARVQPFTEIKLSEAYLEAADVLSDSIQESGANLEIDNLPVIMGDRPQMVQLLQNLIGNAIKYRSEATPQIRITCKDAGHEWMITVKDNGIGIAPEHYQRIFDVFQRLHTQKTIPGTGIGLAICRRVVERHGGKIWLESAPGNGSSFYFTVPKSKE